MREKVSVLQGFRPNEANAIDYRRAEGHFLTPHCDVSLRLRICASSRKAWGKFWIFFLAKPNLN